MKTAAKAIGRPRKPIDLDTVRQLAGNGLSKRSIAARLGFNESGFRDREDVALAFEAGVADLEERLAAVLLERALERKDLISILFALKSRCGWIEAQKLEISGEAENRVSVTLPWNGREPLFEPVSGKSGEPTAANAPQTASNAPQRPVH